ncbi:SPOSA6832_01222 [Sporobolomyces salmonicolor]|uniref:SPOSA6832_01222-mRNA-1:cds n=1 Tax=Sporidiobolus salmonicolor TaxID=5005 RepID=A0A0D6EI92_SPOSA|nr:SPOSA6832_01222 [Sporobolomyces salmonicolor]
MVHLSVGLTRWHGHSQRRHHRTAEERKRAEAHRRDKQVHRASSLLAHLLCPLTALFSLPGLTEHWYVQLNSDGRIVHSKPDPPLIVAAGSVALGFAVLANLALLFRTIDTHPRFFSGVTLAFLSVHTIIDVLALAIFAAEQARPAHYVLSTAFWLTVTSAAIAVAVSALLLIDGMTTRWWRNGGTGLTGKQTSLVISFYMFILVVMIGAVVFRYLLDDVNYLNAIYFSLQTAITTGFGDITPSSTGSRIFAIFWNSLGILSFALLVAFTRATALEAMQEEYKTKERLILARLRKGRSSGAVGSAPCPGVFSRYLAFLTCGIYHTKAQQVEEQAVENLEQEQYSTRDERQDRSLDTGSASKVNPKEEEPELRYEEAIRELRKEREREFRSEVSRLTCCSSKRRQPLMTFAEPVAFRSSFRDLYFSLSGSSVLRFI